jgi:sigma-B regulation protein RsbU (phosphoserine phosphatase)
MLRHLNHFAVQNLASSSFFFTVAAMRLHRARGFLQFTGAGHPPAIIVRQGQSPRLLQSTHMILGLFENAVGADVSVETAVETGDRVVLYTDGLTENFNSHREMLGLDGFQEIVEETSTLPLSEMKSRILERVAAWRHGHAIDDVSLVLLEIS